MEIKQYDIIEYEGELCRVMGISIPNKHPTESYCDCDETIWVKFPESKLPVPLSPYHLEKPIDYDII